MHYNKVEICGVNTSKLPLLKEAEKERLLKLVKQGDTLARDTLIEGNLRLVLSVIQRFPTEVRIVMTCSKLVV